MLPVIWAPSARDDLAEIVDYISDDNPAAAFRLQERLESAVLPLSENPRMYQKSNRLPGCREIVVHKNYVVLYRVAPDYVEVVRVVHARRVYF